jgi:hypothetical protein
VGGTSLDDWRESLAVCLLCATSLSFSVIGEKIDAKNQMSL